MYLFQKIDEFTLHSDSKKTIANFILEKKSAIGKYSLQEIADITYTSKSTLVRFAQTLGFKGWREFAQEFIEEAHKQESHYSDVDANIPFTEFDTLEDIIIKVSSLQVESILDTADLLDVPTLEKAADLLFAAEKIVLFGLSPNSLLAEPFRRKMQTIGVFVIIPHIDEGGLLSCALTENDCAIIISYAGNEQTREPMRFIPTLKKNKVPTIGITGGGNNLIREQIECVFTISSRERLYSKVAGFSTEISITTIFNILFSCCFAKDFKKNWDYKIKNATLLESDRNATLTIMRETDLH